MSRDLFESSATSEHGQGLEHQWLCALDTAEFPFSLFSEVDGFITSGPDYTDYGVRLLAIHIA